MRSSRIQVPAPLAIDLLLHYSTSPLYVIDSTLLAFLWKIQRIDTQITPFFTHLLWKEPLLGSATHVEAVAGNEYCTVELCGRLAQLVRAPPLHGGCRGFESLIAHFPESLRFQRFKHSAPAPRHHVPTFCPHPAKRPAPQRRWCAPHHPDPSRTDPRTRPTSSQPTCAPACAAAP